MSRLNDLRLLHSFMVVFRQRSITRAARELHVSQPALTRCIQTLELEVGARLFERSAAGMTPTAFAERLYRRALSIMNEVDAISGDALELTSRYRRLLTIGSGLICWGTVIDAVLGFQAVAPDVAFNIRVSSARDLAGSSQSHGLDIVVGKQATLESVEWFEVTPLKRVNLFCVVRDGHPVLSLRQDAQLDGLKAFPYASYQLLEDSHGIVVPGTPSIRVNHHLALFRAVAKSDNHLIVSEEMLEYSSLCGLRVVGARPAGIDDLAIAHDRHYLSSTAGDFKLHLLKTASGEGPSPRA